jgi:hypothetical protein
MGQKNRPQLAVNNDYLVTYCKQKGYRQDKKSAGQIKLENSHRFGVR